MMKTKRKLRILEKLAQAGMTLPKSPTERLQTVGEQTPEQRKAFIRAQMKKLEGQTVKVPRLKDKPSRVISSREMLAEAAARKAQGTAAGTETVIKPPTEMKTDTALAKPLTSLGPVSQAPAIEKLMQIIGKSKIAPLTLKDRAAKMVPVAGRAAAAAAAGRAGATAGSAAREEALKAMRGE